MGVTGGEPDREGLGGAGKRDAGRRYHHGDLRAQLVAASFGLLAENGLAGFSVAEVARRTGVSTAAPYRHFRDRDQLLAAVATQAADELTATMYAAAIEAGADPVERLAVTVGAYVRHVTARGAGFDVIFAEDLRHLHDPGLADAGRRLTTVLLDLAQDARPSGPAGALELLEQLIVMAHGYVALDTDGFLSRTRLTDDALAVRATRAAVALVRGGAP